MANEFLLQGQEASNTNFGTDYAAAAEGAVNQRFADLENEEPAVAVAEAPAVAEEAAPPSGGGPSRTLPLSPTQKALLDAIADVESDGSWNQIVGGKKFNSYDDHPRVVGVVTKDGPSTAAGRYQIVASTYDYVAKKLGVKGFSPDVQDVIALHLAEQNYKDATGRDLYEDLENGNAENVRSVLAGKGKATTWQGLQKDKNFKERFDNYRSSYLGVSTPSGPPSPPPGYPADWRIPMPTPANINKDQVNPVNGVDPAAPPANPKPSDVAPNVVPPVESDASKVSTKLNSGLTQAQINQMPADLRAVYQQIEAVNKSYSERSQDINNRSKAIIDQLQPEFENTEQFKTFKSEYEAKAKTLLDETLKNVVEKTNG